MRYASVIGRRNITHNVMWLTKKMDCRKGGFSCQIFVETKKNGPGRAISTAKIFAG
jgi:hypothetical protein